MKRAVFAVVILMGFGAFIPAHAAKCKAPKPGPELSAEEMTELYNCLQPKFQEAYAKKGSEVGTAYSSWKAGSTHPAAPGVHSGQYLMTYVNDVGSIPCSFQGRSHRKSRCRMPVVLNDRIGVAFFDRFDHSAY